MRGRARVLVEEQPFVDAPRPGAGRPGARRIQNDRRRAVDLDGTDIVDAAGTGQDEGHALAARRTGRAGHCGAAVDLKIALIDVVSPRHEIDDGRTVDRDAIAVLPGIPGAGAGPVSAAAGSQRDIDGRILEGVF